MRTTTSRAAVLALGLAALLALGIGASARAEAPRWRLEPAQAPPAPEGVTPAPYPVPVGQVGQISFWEPNRGLLITGGTEEDSGPVSPGIYAYDGVSWHQLATVCGGAEGRIAWAGPDEFWTISDQRPGQPVAAGEAGHLDLRSISLCHFANGVVVGSYAMPLQQADSYSPMDAAACYSPSDCWFAGPSGGFHLHWNGSTVTEVKEPETHRVTGMVNAGNQLYESIWIRSKDSYRPSESTTHPAVIHTIAPEGRLTHCEEVESPFCDLTLFSEERSGLEGEGFLPEYGHGDQPSSLAGFSLATDGGPLGAGVSSVWAAADPAGESTPGAAATAVTVLRKAGGSWSQIVPNVRGESPLPPETYLEGMAASGGNDEAGTEDAVAPEPGGQAAWLSLRGPRGVGAEVARLDAEGSFDEPSAPLTLPEAGEREQGVGYRGEAGPIVCPAAHDCWLATTDESGPVSGWLFHLSEGTPLAADTDPFFDGEDGVIDYRPKDSGVQVIYPILPPADDSLANQQPAPAPTGSPLQAPVASSTPKRGRDLLEHVKSRVLRHRELVISFTLTARAHVQLLGRRKHKVVASTPKRLLKPGRHTLSLELNPARWPEAIQFLATPIGASSPAGGAVSSPNPNDSVET